ncbi:MAG: amino acid adenylation domain-containing protein [Chloroflexales bacterium]|nr:amino acid adenylation domain-containing protein [Chloroflexales bacterium]
MLTCKNHENTIRWQEGERLEHLFEERCDTLNKKRGRADRPAIIVKNTIVTYQELDERANQLARYLLKQGIKSGDRIGILLDKSINTYVSLLAVLKANAAYVPLDPSFPSKRISFIAKDAHLATIITTSNFSDHLDSAAVPLIFVDNAANAISTESPFRLNENEKGTPTDQLCYIIYTSGSTGNPKGVAIDHPSICNFVRVIGKVYGIRESDRVYQGITIAFDFSVEEIWAPLITGATLVPGQSGTCRLGADLADFLHQHEVTVMCCVPTLLATIEKDIPSIRLLIVGGEACPHDLAVRWHRPGRTILNTYGPTEATVTATWSELLPDKPVTIGQPIPSYTIVILDEQQNPVPTGAPGEICIAGIGLARGYVNREDLTQEYFIPDFLNIPNNPSNRIYRTGDLGRINDENEIEYLGRIDTQVKIRGYRIELTEIESVLLNIPQVEQAVVSTFTPESGVPELVAYCKLKKGVSDLSENIRKVLGERLPGYMIPAFIEKISEIPMLPSDKADRKRLPPPTGPRLATTNSAFVEAENETERIISRAIAKALNIEQVSVEDNLFDDLGGHSLAVARAASQLRKETGLSIGLSDFYAYPTVRTLAAYVRQKVESNGVNVSAIRNAAQPKDGVYRPSHKKVWLSGVVQLLFLLIYIGALSIPPILLLNWITHQLSWSLSDFAELFGYTAVTIGAMFVLSLVLPVALKWMLLGRVKEGRHKLWGSFFLRWWMVQKAISLSPHTMFKGTPLINCYYRLMGAKIGQDAMIHTPFFHVPDLITVGSESSIGHSSQIFGYEVQNGFLHLKQVTIGNHCFIGSNSIMMPGARMEDASWLGDQSLLPLNGVIPQDESWSGSPAVKETETNRHILELKEAREHRGTKSTCTPNFLVTLGITASLPLLLLITSLASLGAITVMIATYWVWGGYWYLLSSPLAGFVFVLILSLCIVLTKRIVMPEIREGIYEVNSLMYVRKWIADELMEMSLTLTNALYATLYLPPFLRMLGAKIGKRSEISTISHITPGLLGIGDESFLADIAHVGPSYIYRGLFGVKPVKIGRRSFVGNAAFVPGGNAIMDESLIGVLSIPSATKMSKGSVWLGSPAFYLPRRQLSQSFDESLTYIPSRELYIKRLAYEFFRIILPPTLFSLAGGILWIVFSYLLMNYSVAVAIALSPWLMLLSGVGITAIVIAIKKTLIGRYTPKVKPLWDIFVRRTELVTGLYENAVVPAILDFFTGTPFAAPILRALGVKVGRRCYIETTFITEFDLVEIGADSSIGAMCSLQTHLFEDRVMKMSYVKIGNGCSIGPRSVVLYDSVLEDEVRLDGLSLVMKGEVLPHNTRWRGSPSAKAA